MASTNKTTNYDLSQYIGSDKPTYLGDYNSDMSKIDTQMKTNADNIATAIAGVESATSTANQANTTANQANTTANSASQTASQAQSTANTASSTASSALATATQAQGSANQVAGDLSDFEQELNFTHFDDMTLTATGGTITSQNMKVASNEDGTIAKIYGRCKLNSNGAVTLSGTSRLRPTSNITISCLGFMFANTSDGSISRVASPADVTIATNGNITIASPYAWGDQKDFYLFPCMLFLKDFGDTPSPESN